MQQLKKFILTTVLILFSIQAFSQVNENTLELLQEDSVAQENNLTTIETSPAELVQIEELLNSHKDDLLQESEITQTQISEDKSENEPLEKQVSELNLSEINSVSNTDTDSLSTITGTTSTFSNLKTNEPAEEILEPVVYKKLVLTGQNQPSVEKFRQQYLQPKWGTLLRDSLESAIDYRLYVRKALQDNNMPPELEYLPVVESNYKTTAKSKSGALGLWQFMENSVRPFLTLNDYVDERLDPWKETDAAIKKLQDNYRYFGDWLLAIGAYNCGAGAMTRALAKAKEKDFWYLAEHNLIPSQTCLYVPKLLAIADLANNTEYYQIDIPDHEEEYNTLINEKNGIFDYITVSKAYSLKQLATEMRLDSKELQRLNPSFTKGFTHPSSKSTIRLPLGMEQTAKDALAKIKPIDFPVKYTVVAGDSLWSISRRYGTSVSAICELNGIKENAILKIGKILYIPSK